MPMALQIGQIDNGRTQFTIVEGGGGGGGGGDAHVLKKQSITVVTDCIQFDIFADSRSVTFIT